MKLKLIPAALFIAAAPCLHASILVQELFDSISSGNATLDGAGDTTSSIGMTGVWTTHGSTNIFTSDNFNVDGATLPGLPSGNGGSGGVWNNTATWNSAIYAVRPLAEAIDFAADREIYFSVRLNNAGDSSMGIGLATGGEPTDEFVGAGFSWNNARPMATGQNTAGNAAYLSYGTLNNPTATVNGVAGVIMDGVYGIRAVEPAGSVNGYGLLVGRIILSAAGDDVIQIRRYAENEVIDNNLGAITWTVTSTINSSMSASHLLLWMNGSGTGQLDAIRVGETWTDVTGIELAGPEHPGLAGSAVSSVTANSAQAGVNLVTSAADVMLFWDTIDQGTGTWTSSNALGTKEVGPVTGEITGLSPDTRYYYRFHAVNTAAGPEAEAWSEPGRTFVTSPAGIAVTNLVAEPYSALEMDLSWSDTFATETGFVIQRSPAGAGEWVTVGTVLPNVEFFTDKHSGLTAGATYDYRVFARNEAGDSDPSNIATATSPAGDPLQTRLLIHFNGSLNGTTYTLGEGETDTTGTFKASGSPVIEGGHAVINPGNESGTDGFDIDPNSLGDLTVTNWVAETLVSYQSSGNLATTPVLIDVQGDCNLRLRALDNPDVLQLFYYNGSSPLQHLTSLPPSGVPVHFALAWDARTATLTGYINGAPFGSVSGGPFATPASILSFGYFGRSGFVGRGVDGSLDAVAFQTGSAAFDPATGFLLALPDQQNYTAWIGGFPVGGQNLFGDDPDGDGLLNGIEAFLGTNPGEANGGITQVSTTGTVTTFTHPLAGQSPSDVVGSYEWSPDLVNWYAGDGVAGPSGGPTVNIQSTSSAGSATVTATASAPLPRVFLRIVATRSAN